MDKGMLGGLAAALLVGAGLGWGGAQLAAGDPAGEPAEPGDWVARVDDEYIGSARFIDEMRRRGGRNPGQFHDLAQKQALLDDLLYQKALVATARAEGIADLPEVRRTLDQVLANQVLQRQLRERQQALVVSDEVVRAFYDANVDSFAVPARRRVAVIHIPVAADADPGAWEAAERLAAEARTKATQLGPDIAHFGALAREYSHDQASRYRGGVVGWLSAAEKDRYTHDPVLLEAAFALDGDGAISPVLRGSDGVYLVRLVDAQPAQARAFEDLQAGIRQRLLQERAAEVEHAFRNSLLEGVEVEVDQAALAAIEPLSPPAATAPPQPPALPSEG